MKFPIDKEIRVKTFTPAIRAKKIELYSELIDQYNDIVVAFNELYNHLQVANYTLNDLDNQVEQVNATFRRMGISDRVLDIQSIGRAVAQVFWKVRHVSQTQPLPRVHETGSGQVGE